MTAAVAPIAALLLSVALLLMGNGLQSTLLPFRANLEAFGALGIGVLGSSYFLGFALGCLRGGFVVRRAGHIRTFTAMVAIASCVVLGHALIVNPFVWWLLRAVTGFCFAVLYMVIESWLNERATNENRGAVFSVYIIINLTVMTLGQFMLVLGRPTDFPLFAAASILVSLAAVPIALTRSEAPAPIAAVDIRIRRLYRLSPVGVVGCAAVGLANGSFWALGPIFAQVDGGGAARVALFMSVVVLAGAMGQWPLGRLSDKIDRRKVIVLAAVGAAAAGLGMVASAQLWDPGILLTAFLFGLFAMPIYPVSVAHMNDFIEQRGYLNAAGGLLLVFALGAVLGPLLASVVVGFAGIKYLFAYTATIHIALAGFAVYRMLIRSPAPETEHVPFADALRIAQTVSTVDPLSPADGPDDDQASRRTRATADPPGGGK